MKEKMKWFGIKSWKKQRRRRRMEGERVKRGKKDWGEKKGGRRKKEGKKG